MPDALTDRAKGEWNYGSIPVGRRLIVAAYHNDNHDTRIVGIGECGMVDGKKEITVDIGVEIFSLELPVTVYAWRELPFPPPIPKKEELQCQMP